MKISIISNKILSFIYLHHISSHISQYRCEVSCMFVPSVHSEDDDHTNISHCQDEMHQNNLPLLFKCNLYKTHVFSSQRATVYSGHRGSLVSQPFVSIRKKKVEIVKLVWLLTINILEFHRAQQEELCVCACVCVVSPACCCEIICSQTERSSSRQEHSRTQAVPPTTNYFITDLENITQFKLVSGDTS